MLRRSLADAPGKRPGKQNQSGLGVRGSTVERKMSVHGGARQLPLRPVVRVENSDLGTQPTPEKRLRGRVRKSGRSKRVLGLKRPDTGGEDSPTACEEIDALSLRRDTSGGLI
jgi:hypothetical protein